MNVSIIIKTTPCHVLSYQLLISEDFSCFSPTSWYCLSTSWFFFCLYFFMWSFWGLLSVEEVKLSNFSQVKMLCLGSISSFMKSNVLCKVPGYFLWFVVYSLGVVAFVISELLPYVSGFSLSLHLLLVFSLSFYCAYEISSWSGNLSWALGGMTFSGVSPVASVITVWFEYLSQAIRPWAMGLRFTLHGYASIIMLDLLWRWLMLRASDMHGWALESMKSYFLEFFGVEPVYWDILEYGNFSPQFISSLVFGFQGGVFYLGAVFIWSVVGLVEFGFTLLQLGIFLFLVLFFSSEHSCKK